MPPGSKPRGKARGRLACVRGSRKGVGVPAAPPAMPGFPVGSWRRVRVEGGPPQGSPEVCEAGGTKAGAPRPQQRRGCIVGSPSMPGAPPCPARSRGGGRGGGTATLPTETTSPRLPCTLPPPSPAPPGGLLGGGGGQPPAPGPRRPWHPALAGGEARRRGGTRGRGARETLRKGPARCGVGGTAAAGQVASGKLRWERGVLGRGAGRAPPPLHPSPGGKGWREEVGAGVSGGGAREGGEGEGRGGKGGGGGALC